MIGLQEPEAHITTNKRLKTLELEEEPTRQLPSLQSQHLSLQSQTPEEQESVGREGNGSLQKKRRREERYAIPHLQHLHQLKLSHPDGPKAAIKPTDSRLRVWNTN